MRRIPYAPPRDELRSVRWRRVNEKSWRQAASGPRSGAAPAPVPETRQRPERVFEELGAERRPRAWDGRLRKGISINIVHTEAME